MNSNGESEVVEYIYERMVRLMLPVSQMPKSFRAFASPLMDGGSRQKDCTAIIAMDRSSFEQLIQLLLGFERQSKPISQVHTRRGATRLSRRHYSGSEMVPDEFLNKLCKKQHRLCELYDLMQHVSDDFVAYIQISARKFEFSHIDEHHQYGKLEFTIGLAGFDVFAGVSGKALPRYEFQQVVNRWEQICWNRKYFSDFSALLGMSEDNALIFVMDYEKVKTVV